MDIRQLKRFVTVAELGSFNKAASLLAVSQPSLTRSIQMLEEALDAQLFERGARGIVLTDVGEELLPHARVILSERDRAVAAIQSLHDQRHARVAIGSEATFSTRRLPLALTHLAASHPAIQASVKEGNLHEMLGELREGALSLVVGSRAPYLDMTDIDFEELWLERASIMMRADHPLLAGDPPTLSQLTTARWIVSDNAVTMEGWSQMFLRNNLPVPAVGLRTSSLQLSKGCLLHGDFVSLGDHTSYLDEIRAGRIVRLDFNQPSYRRPAGLFRRRGSKLSANERAFCAALRASADIDGQAGDE